MDALDQPPRDARVSVRADAVTIHLAPWLVERGRHDATLFALGRLLGQGLPWAQRRAVGFALVVALGFVQWVLGTGASFGLLAVGVVLLVGWLVVDGWRDEQRARQELDLVLTRHELRAVWRIGDTVEREERVALRDIGRVDAREAGYQRQHVVALVAGREPLTLPVERESDEVAAWLAGLLASLGRRAREEGGGAWEVPEELRVLQGAATPGS